MEGHFECFDSECYFVSDTIRLCCVGDTIRLLQGEYAGDIAKFQITNGCPCLIGADFCIDHLNGVRAETSEKGFHYYDWQTREICPQKLKL